MLNYLHAIQELQIKLWPCQAEMDSYMGKSKEKYPQWIAESMKMRGQRGEGEKPELAIDDLIAKLNL